MPRVETFAMATAMLMCAVVQHAAYEASLRVERVVAGVRVEGTDVGGLGREQLVDLAAHLEQTALDRELLLVAGNVSVPSSARALGAIPVQKDVIDQALSVGRRHGLLANLSERVAAGRGAVDVAVGHRFEQEQALARLRELVPEVERPSLPTRFDLDGRRVLAAERGAELLPYDSLSAIAIGLASGADRIELPVQDKPPVADPLAPIADQLDVSTRLGSFETPYSSEAGLADRVHNLEVAAAAVNGMVVMPHETFSFNEVVGAREAEEGYRYAPGITAGEMVDVLGGGICQISSTLYGAAFFAGLDLVLARPHSRPSSYVDMGLDSTVVYPTVDMKLRNPFDFPIVLHMSVRQGKVFAEVLGPRRPYQVAFEREIEEVLPFRTVYRDDPTLRLGHEEVSQAGKRGFHGKRRRILLHEGKPARTEEWELHYPPTAEIRHRGTSPVGAIPPPKSIPGLRDPARRLRIVQ